MINYQQAKNILKKAKIKIQEEEILVKNLWSDSSLKEENQEPKKKKKKKQKSPDAFENNIQPVKIDAIYDFKAFE